MDDSNILQADVTVIAGLLILLTVAYYLAPKDPAEVAGKFATYTVTSISRLVIIVVALFSLSAILVTLGNGSFTITLAGLGKYVMMVGFGALAIGISWLLGSKATKSWVNSQKGV